MIIRRVTTVSGGMFFNAVFVAINEAAQKKQAAAKANLADIGTFCCWAFISIIQFLFAGMNGARDVTVKLYFIAISAVMQYKK